VIVETTLYDHLYENSSRDGAIKSVLKSSTRPMAAGDVARAMLEGGFQHSEGEQHLRNLVFMLFSRKDDEYEKVKQEGKTLWRYIGQ